MKEILTSKKLESKEFIRFYYNINKPVLDLLSFAEVWISGIDFFFVKDSESELSKAGEYIIKHIYISIWTQSRFV